ncbi:MAG: sugar phosphate isomerase/epimerase [Acidobacteriaceae bacterium]|nr:sugar phosphate isomerase/epimerase [Acidobacteriaceae bacterium]
MLSRREMLAVMGASLARAAAAEDRLKICVFSKHFQWTDWREASKLAAQIGFDGIDYTVRTGGHVLPERVKQDLPKAVEIAHKAGLETPMITAGIVDTSSPHAEAILETASGLGIKHYRWGGFKYDYGRSIAEQLNELQPKVHALAELNAKYGMAAMYHTHSGLREVGAPIWDVWTLLKNEDPRYVGVNYDIGHATVEGGYGGWVDSAHLVGPYMRGVALKDFLWGKNAKGAWVPQWCAAGKGMVNFPAFFELLKTAKFSGPVQLHFEYPELGGANDGKTQLEIPKERVVAIMKRDLQYVKGLMSAAQLV